MSGTVIPNVPPQFFANDGTIAAGYKLFAYAAGTTTKINSYSDAALATPNTNPIVLDSAGRATIFLSATSYKFVLAPPTDTDPPSSPIWTRDNVLSLAGFNVQVDIQVTAGESLQVNDVCYMSAGDGGLTAGRWYRCNASNTYSSVSAHSVGFAIETIASGTTGAIRILGRLEGFAGLTAGAVYYINGGAFIGQITATPDPINPRIVAQADSTTSIVTSQWLPSSLARLNAYTTPGADTWTKHPDAKQVRVLCVGAGGGGGSGRKGLAGTARVGGGGAGGGAVSLLEIQASQLTATVAVSVGTGGTGGAAQATNSTNGNNGTNGGSTNFGAFLNAEGGLLGAGGQAGAGGTGGNGGSFAFIGGTGGTADAAGGVGGVGGVPSNIAGGGGGAGGGITAANAASAGTNGAAGARGSSTATAGAGGAAGIAGGVGLPAPVNSAIGGGGGGGGGGSTAGNAGAGGNGGLYGGAGGGGGAAVDAVGNSGKGGDGGNGLILVIQY